VHTNTSTADFVPIVFLS